MKVKVDIFIKVTLFSLFFFLGVTDMYFFIINRQNQRQISDLHKGINELRQEVRENNEDINENKITIWQLYQKHFGVVDIDTTQGE